MEVGGLKRLEKADVVCMQSELIREMKIVFWTFEIGNCHSVVDQLSCWWYSVAMLSCLHTRVNRFGIQVFVGLGFCQMTVLKRQCNKKH